MRVFILHKTNYLEYTALCLLRKAFMDDTDIMHVSIEKYIADDSMVKELNSLLKESEPKNTCIIMLNNYTTTALEKMIGALDDNIKRFIMLPKDSEKRTINQLKMVFYEDDNYLISLLNTLQSLDIELNNEYLEKLKELAENFKDSSTTNLISSSAILKIDSTYDVISKEERINLLKQEKQFSRNINNEIGIQLSLILNYKKIDSYYNWMCTRLSKQLTHNNFKKNFFTKAEIETMYSSWDTRILNLLKACYSCDVSILTRTVEQSNQESIIYYIKTVNASKALNTVYLHVGLKNGVECVVSCTDKFSVISQYDNENNIKHKIIRYPVEIEDINNVV